MADKGLIYMVKSIGLRTVSEELFQCCDQDDMLIEKYCKDCVS